jgi:hypothetical protein
MVNATLDLNATIQSVVRQSFPFATPSTTVLNLTEKETRATEGSRSSRIEGSKRERFTWGSSKIGGSFVLG